MYDHTAHVKQCPILYLWEFKMIKMLQQGRVNLHQNHRGEKW